MYRIEIYSWTDIKEVPTKSLVWFLFLWWPWLASFCFVWSDVSGGLDGSSGQFYTMAWLHKFNQPEDSAKIKLRQLTIQYCKPSAWLPPSIHTNNKLITEKIAGYCCNRERTSFVSHWTLCGYIECKVDYHFVNTIAAMLHFVLSTELQIRVLFITILTKWLIITIN